MTFVSRNNVQNADADVGIRIRQGTVKITKGTAAALTLADPGPGDEGSTLFIVSTTAAAHTVTYSTTGFNGAGAGGDVATFGGAAGDSLILKALGSVWYVVGSTNVTIA